MGKCPCNGEAYEKITVSADRTAITLRLQFNAGRRTHQPAGDYLRNYRSH